VLVGLGAVVLVLVGVAALQLLLWPHVVGAQPAADPGSIVDGLEQARLRRDFDGALSYFAEDATVTDRGSQVYRGKDEIRRYFQLVASRGRQPAVVNRRVNGDRVLWTERAAGQTSLIFELSAEAIVRDGKVRSLSFAAAGTAGRPDPNADGRTTLPSFVGLGAVLVTLLGLVTLSSGLGGARPRPDSRLKGRLLDQLGAWRRSANEPG
jgi:ketosteroid isomerase-like protein